MGKHLRGLWLSGKSTGIKVQTLFQLQSGLIVGLTSFFWGLGVFVSGFVLSTLRGLCVHAQLLQSCPTLCDPVDHSPPGSSVHGILQAGILEWAAIPSSRGSSRPRDGTRISCGSCIVGRFFTAQPRGKPRGLSTWGLKPRLWSQTA